MANFPEIHPRRRTLQRHLVTHPRIPSAIKVSINFSHNSPHSWLKRHFEMTFSAQHKPLLKALQKYNVPTNVPGRVSIRRDFLSLCDQQSRTNRKTLPDGKSRRKEVPSRMNGSREVERYGGNAQAGSMCYGLSNRSPTRISHTPGRSANQSLTRKRRSS